ncbi:hypothetical protein T492DRAFT_892668 [Pavlovales sp. CCMP2436]|nr:hypothetical protein T492DRAFT_892668 [Pavlovales sp. CCMP2436]
MVVVEPQWDESLKLELLRPSDAFVELFSLYVTTGKPESTAVSGAQPDELVATATPPAGSTWDKLGVGQVDLFLRLSDLSADKVLAGLTRRAQLRARWRDAYRVLLGGSGSGVGIGSGGGGGRSGFASGAQQTDRAAGRRGWMPSILHLRS